MKKAYYVVEMEYGEYGDNNSLIFSGNKNVTIYTILDDEIINIGNLDLDYEDNSEEEVKKYLCISSIGSKWGYDEENFELVRL